MQDHVMRDHVWILEEYIYDNWTLFSTHDSRTRAREMRTRLLKISPKAVTRIRKFIAA